MDFLFIFKFPWGRGEGKKAADCLRTALREYDLKFGTILNDPDLASFRSLPEFKELQEEVCVCLFFQSYFIFSICSILLHFFKILHIALEIFLSRD